MFTLPEYFYDINIISISTRLLLAVLFGGIIGLERGSNRHPAGFRTHILVCVGATLAMMTNQYITEFFDTTDPARLGAQVITGVGFLGVGTILVTGKNRIKGLTTAAGLWASACLGLALGIGFYSGALVAGIIIFVSLALLPRVENYFYNKSRVLDLYIEVSRLEDFKAVRTYVKSLEPSFYDSHISESPAVVKDNIAFNLSVVLPKGLTGKELRKNIEAINGVVFVEDIS